MQWVEFEETDYPVLLQDNIECSVPGHWAPYVKQLLDNLLWKVQNKKEYSTLRVAQIKEKFGTLRVYVDFEPVVDENSLYTAEYYKGVVYGLIEHTETLCNKTCVKCGSQEDVVNTAKKGGMWVWISPRCKEHRE